MNRLLIAIAVGIPLAASAAAEGTNAGSRDRTSLGELIASSPECTQFNDGCSICSVRNGEAICSTPGIACVAKGWACAAEASKASAEQDAAE